MITPMTSDRASRVLHRSSGPVVAFGAPAVWAAAWVFLKPAGVAWGSFAGQLCGALAILLMAMAVVLISMLAWVEAWFDGIDRAAIWHRRLAITGMLLLAPHLLLSGNQSPSAIGPGLAVGSLLGLVTLVVWSVLPRWRSVLPHLVRGVVARLVATTPARLVDRVLGGYDRWRAVHRLTGLFLGIGFLHGLLDATAFGGSGALRWSYVAVGGIGLAFYAYRELLARRFAPLHDFEVAAVTPVGDGLTEITLRPLGRRFAFVPGQFAMVFLEARDGWHRHPFTIASGAAEDDLRITVKALGDWTGKVADRIAPGMPAVVGGPHGRFDHRKAKGHQVWIAGGVGVTPFLSWLRSLDHRPAGGHVDFFYTSAEEPVPYAEEIAALAEQHGVDVHLFGTAAGRRLNIDAVVDAVATDPSALSAFLCGPEGLVATMTTGLRAAGIPRRRIHREYFDWR